MMGKTPVDSDKFNIVVIVGRVTGNVSLRSLTGTSSAPTALLVLRMIALRTSYSDTCVNELDEEIDDYEDSDTAPILVKSVIS